MPLPAHTPAEPVDECVTFPCAFPAARDACRYLCGLLTPLGVSEEERFACELALTEACNNAVQHVGDSGRRLPVTARVSCTPSRVEFQVVDHTHGFVWPTEPPVPPGPDAEHGRGLFIIRSMMDGAQYDRGQGENTLTMWKSRGPAVSS